MTTKPPLPHVTTDASGVKNAWVMQPLDERWVAAFRLVTSGGRVRVGEARVFPLEDGYHKCGGEWADGRRRGIDAEAPRRGLTKEMLARAQPHAWLSLLRATAMGRALAEVLGLRQESKVAPTPAAGRGRPAHDDVFLARVARDYQRAVEAGHAPIRSLAAAHGEKVVKVRGWVHAARIRGYLTPSVQGKTEGRLTAKGTHVLASEAKRRKR
jgi:hypothetical protein